MSIKLTAVTVDLPIYSVNARSLRQSALAAVGGKLLKRGNDSVMVRALSNVSVEINDGDRVALIGPNGAGKTTLLRVMAGVYAPTSGRVAVHGKVSAALNVGLGLDPELSGRENIEILAYYRGKSRRELNAHIDEIVDATELGAFIDLPVRTYSSGMMGRLTFATATAFDPDVLLMDEWLLAGDQRFLDQAAERMEAFVSRARILVLASHSLEIVSRFCNKAIWLEQGQVAAAGPVEEVVSRYEATAAA